MAGTVIGNCAIDMMSTDEEKEENRKQRRLQELGQVDPNVVKCCELQGNCCSEYLTTSASTYKYDV